jgi:DNA invertase Pin-like site-specific DNA recombinase
MTVFAGIAEFERDLIRERTGAGREAVKKGRPIRTPPKTYFRSETVGGSSYERREVSPGDRRNFPCT